MIKRLFDLFIALIVLIIIFPLMLFLVLAVFIFIGRPIFFSQERPGVNEKIFRMYKFRSMKNIYDEKGVPLPDSERITKFGLLLRKSSLDELPALLNVVTGDMSLVGPRPLLVRYLPYYTEEEKKRHTLRPGITGLAQINGRNTVSWDERFKFDIEYVEKQSFLLDLKILLLTLLKVVKRDDVTSIPNEIMDDLDVQRKFSNK